MRNVAGLPFMEALGPPFVSKKAAEEIDEVVIERFWEKLVGEEEDIITKRKMEKRMKALCGDAEGLTWSMFQSKIIE